MTIKQIHYFIAVAETKSFTNAARNYFIAQTAMSQQISALEKELGFLLFHRSNRSVELTQAGQTLYEQVRPLVLDLERAVEHASSVAGVQPLFSGLVCLIRQSTVFWFLRSRNLSERNRMCSPRSSAITT